MAAGALCGTAMGLLSPLLGPVEAALMGATMFGVLGFVGGGLFSTVLVIADGRRRFDQLATPRFAALGTVGGVALGAAVGVIGGFVTLYAMRRAARARERRVRAASALTR